jgi:spermidine synthase
MIDSEITHEARLSTWTRTVCGLFFVSGVPALIYQLVWQRALFRILGVNIESVTVVVTAFMIGLGLGSLAGGWLSRRSRLPLLPLLAIIELLTALFGIESLALFENVGAAALGQNAVLVAAVTLGLVVIPTLLMGATLPVLVGQMTRRLGNVGRSLGLLYYCNTLGAGAACLICVAVLFPFLGMQYSIYIAAFLNIAVSVAAIIADRRYRGLFVQNLAECESSSRPTFVIASFPTVLGLACMGGWISLSYEIFFFRTISYATGSSPAAFAATLGAFLIGIASGSRRCGELCASRGNYALIRRVIGELLAASLVGVLFLPLLSHLAWVGKGVLGLALVMVYLLARCWGMLLPCLAHLGVAANGRAGMRTGLLYLANIAGAALGTVISGFVLMDFFGLIGLAQLLAAAALCYAIVFMSVARGFRRVRVFRAAAATALGALTVISIPSLTGNVLEALQYKDTLDANATFARIVENRSGIITVDRSGTVFGNGIYDGQFNVDLVHDSNGIVRPFALSLFHRAPRHVLMIGFSSGSWAQVIANNPDVESLTIVEINPGYRDLAAHTPQVVSVLGNPKVKLVADDGRRWLRLNQTQRFDIIVSNTTYHFRANATNLLSEEFLALVKEHLNPEGVFFYNTTSSERVQRTGCTVFPFGARFTNHMVLSSAPMAWDFDRWQRNLEAYRIDNRPVLNLAAAEDQVVLQRLMSLRSAFGADVVQDRNTPIERCEQILARTKDRMRVTDDNMGTEWRYFWGRE